MSAKNYSVMAAIMIGCFGCGSTLPKMHEYESIEKSSQFFGPRYTQNGKAIDPGDMADKLEKEPKAAPHVGRARALRVVSTILAAAGGALVGWPLGGYIGGDRRPNWKLAAVGGGAIAIGIPLAIWSDFSMDTGVEVHNKHLETTAWASAPPVGLASTRTWKPGERAGAPSTPSDASSNADSAAACQKAGHKWSEDASGAHCSGTPSTEIPGVSAPFGFTY